MSAAEDPTSALGVEYTMMAQDPVIKGIRRAILELYRRHQEVNIYRVINGGAYGSYIRKVTQSRSYLTGTRFFVVDFVDGRTLRFFITSVELEMYGR